MKKFINKTDDFIVDSLKGFAKAHADIVALNLDPIFMTRKEINPNKVLLVSGGGSGHEPLHTGYIGKGMLDVACPLLQVLHHEIVVMHLFDYDKSCIALCK